MEFQKISIKDYTRLRPFFDHQSYELCSYSLPSILSWRTDAYHPVATEVDGSLVVAAEYERQPGLRHLMLPVSGKKEWTPEALHALCCTTGFDNYWFVPEDWIQHWGEDRVAASFVVEEQTAYEDYVYNREDLSELKGRKYAKKRNLISQFERAHDPASIDLSPITAADTDACQEFLERWCIERGCDRDPETDLACEKIAAANAIGLLDNTDFRGLMLRLDGEVVAFGIANKITDEMGALHFEKALGSVKGLYQFFDRECARQLFSDEIRFINKESDMDEPGLAKAKQSYYPARMIKSFKLTAK